MIKKLSYLIVFITILLIAAPANAADKITLPDGSIIHYRAGDVIAHSVFEWYKGTRQVGSISLGDLTQNWMRRNWIDSDTSSRIQELIDMNNQEPDNYVGGISANCTFFKQENVRLVLIVFFEFGSGVHPVITTILARVTTTPHFDIAPVKRISVHNNNLGYTIRPGIVQFGSTLTLWNEPGLYVIKKGGSRITLVTHIPNEYDGMGAVANRWIVFKGEKYVPKTQGTTYIRSFDLKTRRFLRWTRKIHHSEQFQLRVLVNKSSAQMDLVNDLNHVIPAANHLTLSIPGNKLTQSTK